MRSSRLWLYALGALSAIVAGCGETPIAPSAGVAPTPTPFATPTPIGLETPAAGSIYLGAYVSPSPNGNVATIEKQIQRKLALDLHYYSWAALFPSTAEDTDLTNRRIPVESWDCGASDAEVVAGDEDLLIQTRAQAIKNYGHPVFLRYMWDANLPAAETGRTSCYDSSTDNADGTFSAAEYVAAWNHIRSIFASESVTNVVWVWSVASSGNDPRAYFPGSNEVDWAGIDAYDTAGSGLATMLSPSYTLLAPFAKPMLVVTGESPSLQPAFFANAPAALQTQFPLIAGFTYYDGANTFGTWSLSAAGVSALATLGANPYFSAYGSP